MSLVMSQPPSTRIWNSQTTWSLETKHWGSDEHLKERICPKNLDRGRREGATATGRKPASSGRRRGGVLKLRDHIGGEEGLATGMREGTTVADGREGAMTSFA
jgi:hypothetical protein